MKCNKCGKDTLLAEDLGGGKKKLHCSSCGLTEIKDAQGRKLLTEDDPMRAPARAERRLLVEG